MRAISYKKAIEILREASRGAYIDLDMLMPTLLERLQEHEEIMPDYKFNSVDGLCEAFERNSKDLHFYSLHSARQLGEYAQISPKTIAKLTKAGILSEESDHYTKGYYPYKCYENLLAYKKYLTKRHN